MCITKLKKVIHYQHGRAIYLVKQIAFFEKIWWARQHGKKDEGYYTYQTYRFMHVFGSELKMYVNSQN